MMMLNNVWSEDDTTRKDVGSGKTGKYQIR